MFRKFGFFILLILTMIRIVQGQDVAAIMQQVDSLSAEPEKALTLINRAIDTTPNSEQLLKVRAEIQTQLKLYGKAADDYRKLTAAVPDDESYWYQLGYNLLEDKQYAEAVTAENHAIKLNDQYLPAFHVKIKALIKLNKLDEALKTSDATLKIGETAMNYYLQGEVNRLLNARQKAEWAYTKAVKIDKGLIDGYIALSSLAAETNKAAEAIEFAEKALEINEDSEAALIARSRGSEILKHLQYALDDVNDVLRRNPNNEDAHYWRAIYLLANHQPQESLKDFEWVLTKTPANWHAQAGKADCYAALGKKDDALNGYKQLLADAARYPDKEAVKQLADQRIFELNRENRAPVIALEGVEADNFDIKVPDNMPSFTLKGEITDESPVSKLIVNGKEVPLKTEGGKTEFAANVPTDLSDITLEVHDVYNNVNKTSYHFVKTETVKPEIVLFAPKADDKGAIILTASESSELYVEGKVSDASFIATITVDGQAVDFDREEQNPVFSSVVDISKKTSFSVVATDLNGNVAEKVYRIEKGVVQSAGSSTSQQPSAKPPVERASN